MRPLASMVRLATILRKTTNPVPLILDHLGLKTRPYRVRLGPGVVIELRPRSGDRFGFYEVGIREDYFNAGQVLRRGDTVVDVGANIGCFTIMAARRVGPTGRVIAIEPEALAYEQLTRNLTLNRISNVSTRRLALGGTTGTVALHTTGESGLFSSIYQRVNHVVVSADEQIVPMMTLGDFLAQERVTRCHYLKLDCEGAEHDIIGTLSPEDAGRIDQITMELHKIEGKDGSQIATTLQRYGFSLVGRPGCYYLLEAG